MRESESLSEGVSEGGSELVGDGHRLWPNRQECARLVNTHDKQSLTLCFKYFTGIPPQLKNEPRVCVSSTKRTCPQAVPSPTTNRSCMHDWERLVPPLLSTA